MICKNCKKTFHYCSNCDYDLANSLDFCSDTCFYDSDIYKSNIKKIDEFVESLNVEQLTIFDRMMSESDIFENYEYEIISKINERLND